MFRLVARADPSARAHLKQLPRAERWRRFKMRNAIMWSLRWQRIRYHRRNKRARAWYADYLAKLNAGIPDLHFDSFGDGMPAQGFGTYRGQPFYYRFRHDQASLEVYAHTVDDDRPVLCSVVSGVTGRPYAGDRLPIDEQIDLLRRLVDQLAAYDEQDNPSSVDRLAAAVQQLVEHRESEES